MSTPTTKTASLPLAQLTPEMAKLQEKFGADALVAAPYDGLLLNDPAKLLDVARYCRDELDYNMLANATAVDYAKEGYIEVVHQMQRVPGGGSPITLKVRVPRGDAVAPTEPIPSLVSVYPGAEFQEREIYDMRRLFFRAPRPAAHSHVGWV